MPIGVSVASRERKRVTESPGAGEKRFDQFEIANGDSIEHQALLALVVADAIDVIERAALGGADVVQHGASRGGCGGSAGESKAFERKDAEMILDERDGVVGGEDPVVERSLRPLGVSGSSDAEPRGSVA